MKLLLVASVLWSLLGNPSLNFDKPTATSTGEESTVAGMEESLFAERLSVQKNIKTNENFTIKSELQVNTDQKLNIESRKNMFVFVIKDRNGKQINSTMISDVGINRELKGKTTISEVYSYKIKIPGTYEVSAIAEFTVKRDGKTQNYRIETDPQKVEVTENAQ